ncbi:MAG TPA: hypothetical protein VE127_09895 [Solirubrobacteraceae bacterium]|nr:hypothetical protein [Solirubrobacteraceae bacterium]
MLVAHADGAMQRRFEHDDQVGEKLAVQARLIPRAADEITAGSDSANGPGARGGGGISAPSGFRTAANSQSPG